MRTLVARGGLVVLALALGQLLTFAQTPASSPAGDSRPATRKAASAPAKPQAASASASAEVLAARKAIAAAVSTLIKDLSSNSSSRREAAQAALTELSEGVLAEVVDQSKLTDAEHVARAGELFATLCVSARQGQMMLALPAAQRKLAAAFAQEQPKLFNTVFGENTEAAAKAMPELAESSSPAAAILMAWAIRNRSWDVRLAAIKAAADMEKPQADLADAVCSQMIKTTPKPPAEDAGAHAGADTDAAAGIWEQIGQIEHTSAILAMVAMKDNRVLPRLLDVLLNNNGTLDAAGPNDNTSVVEMIRQFKDKRIVVTLMDYVKSNDEITTMNYDNNKKVTILKGDIAMMVILLQTGQKIADYGYFIPPDMDENDPNPQLGFETTAKRKEARKKLREWWDANKAAYEGIEKIRFGKEDEHIRANVPAFVGGMKK